MTLLQYIGETVLQGVEGMLHIAFLKTADGIGVSIPKIKGMAYFIPFELGESWLVNNSIDLETWNVI